MSILKDLFIEEYETLFSEAEESGLPVDEDKLADLAHKRSVQRFADMIDAAKDRAKYASKEQA